MKKSYGSLVSVAGVLCAIAPMTGSAQEFFREYGTSRSSGGIGPVTAGDYTYQDISPSGLQSLDPATPLDNGGPMMSSGDLGADKSNFAIGPVHFALAVGFGAEFNDNITYSQDHRESDVVLRPEADIEAIFRMTEFNSVRLSFAISYAKYLDHSEFDTDGLLISPTSDIEFTFRLGQVEITLRDRLSYQEEPFDIPQLSGVAKYDRWENQAGFQAKYDFNSKMRLEGGYDHYNLWTKQDFFKDQERSIDTLFLKPSYGVSDSVRVGLNATYSFINFESGDRSDGYSIFVGPTLEWQLSQNTEIYLEAGYQSLKFDGDYRPSHLLDNLTQDLSSDEISQLTRGASDRQDSDSYYVRLEAENKPSNDYQHRLSFSKTTEIGFFSDYYDLYHVEYNAEYKGFKKTSIGPSIFYEYYETSGDLPEKANRIGALLGIRHYLTNSITLGLDYRFLWKDSNLPGSDYYQNLAFLSIYYKF